MVQPRHALSNIGKSSEKELSSRALPPSGLAVSDAEGRVSASVTGETQNVDGADDGVELTVVIPCLNEADTLESCLEKAQRGLRSARVVGEIIVADNGSTDGSIEIASRMGVRVVNVPEKGYGSALMGGIAAARGKFIIMGDADGSYDFEAFRISSRNSARATTWCRAAACPRVAERSCRARCPFTIVGSAIRCFPRWLALVRSPLAISTAACAASRGHTTALGSDAPAWNSPPR